MEKKKSTYRYLGTEFFLLPQNTKFVKCTFLNLLWKLSSSGDKSTFEDWHLRKIDNGIGNLGGKKTDFAWLDKQKFL